MSNDNAASDAPAGPTAVLADDERLMREQLRARLAEVWPELQVVAEARNGTEAVELVEQHRPDVVFLDIRMPGLTGVEAARRIAQMAPRTGSAPDGSFDDDLLPEIVFITAYDQYAVDAFEQGVADYVLKPAERERLQLTVTRIQQRLAARRGANDAGGYEASGYEAGEAAPPSPNLQQV
ncbi:MAG: response regulator, partial [Rubrivivax sp.]